MREFSEFEKEYLSLLNECGLSQYTNNSRDMYEICCHLEKANSMFNLTAIRDEHEMLLKHIIDSLIVAKHISEYVSEGSLIDVGSGAGFPSLPLSFALDKVNVTAIDSTAKKMNYINDTAKDMDNKNIHAIACRAEDIAHDKSREKFDVVTARAVARLPILIELCAPLIKVGGIFVAIKGETAPEEVKDSEKGAKLLGCKLEKTISYTLPSLTDQRYLLIYRKESKTDKKYPRNYSQISKKPL